MQEYQLRVVIEKAELDIKIQKLAAFMETEIWKKLPTEEVLRLEKQYNLMVDYSYVLGERISAFKN